jgi:hypothetical protein
VLELDGEIVIEQLELRLEELEAGEAEESSKAAAEDRPLPLREGTRPKRNNLPDHLPRQEIVFRARDSENCCSMKRPNER